MTRRPLSRRAIWLIAIGANFALWLLIIALAFAFAADLPRSLALGDSIAVGTGAALGMPTTARVGASSCAILGFTPGGYFDRIVISAGVNDEPGRCVAALRARFTSAHVVWIRPINSAGPTVDAVAARYGDRVIRYAVGRDHLHPASYAAVAASVRAAWGS